MDSSSPSQHKSKNFHLVNTTQKKITCLMGEKSGRKIIPLQKNSLYTLFLINGGALWAEQHIISLHSVSL